MLPPRFTLLVLSSATLLGPASAQPKHAEPAPPPRVLVADAPAVIPSEATPLLQALRERRVLTFRYHGHERVVEPHACGIATNGERVLHGYQTAGGSVKGDLPGWRTFTLAEIGALVVTEKTFAGPRPDYAAAHLRLQPLWGELTPRE